MTINANDFVRLADLTAGALITIERITYVVEQFADLDAIEARGHGNIARCMREVGNAGELVLRRPKGRKQYFAVVSARGAVTNVVGL